MARIYWDRHAGTSTSEIQRVVVDEVNLTNWQGMSTKSLPRQVVCERGRVLGSQSNYAHARIDGGVANLTAAECRALAESLSVAADVLEGKQEAESLAQMRREQKEQRERSTAEHAEREQRLIEDGVDLICSGCGQSKRIMPDRVDDWLKQRPFCCKKRSRAYTLANAMATN
jgi:hypothetical protein